MLLSQLTNIVLEYFDPNVTSHIQPLDMGIIRSTKAHYRKALVKYCLLKIEEKGEIIMPTIKDAIIMIKNAWKQVNYIISYYIYSVYVYKCIYLLGKKRNNS